MWCAPTAKLGQLRPVTFHLKTDPKGALPYGLIAEEVAKVYPELVIRDGTGRIDGVRYDELAPMLLKEAQEQDAKIHDIKAQQLAAQANPLRGMQQQQRKFVAQAEQLRDVQRQLAELKDLKQKMQAALRKRQAKDELVAQR